MTGETLPNSLVSYYSSLDAVSDYDFCEHRVVSLVPRQAESEAYEAYSNGVIDDYMVARPVYELHRIILICEHLLIELGVLVNSHKQGKNFVKHLEQYPQNMQGFLKSGADRKADMRLAFEQSISDIDKALDRAAEDIQSNQSVKLDLKKLKQTLSLIRSDEIRPELIQLQIKALDLLQQTIGLSSSESADADHAIEATENKEKADSYQFNRLYQQDIDPDSVLKARSKVPSVLVVEDDIISLQLTLKLLKAYNLKVDTVNTGRKALAALTGEKYSLVLMDINLPDTNGIYIVDQTCNQEGLNKGTPVIMLSGNKDKATVETALKRGAKGYILKPLYKASVVKLFTKYKLPLKVKGA
jgi:CheY-like chemotaxis protein